MALVSATHHRLTTPAAQLEREDAERATKHADEEQEAKRAQQQKYRQEKLAAQTNGQVRQAQPDRAAAFAAVLNFGYQQRGGDVTVTGFDDALVFDCSSALDPRTTCYLIYKGYPPNREEVQLLRSTGIQTLQFQVEHGLFSGFAWTKHI